MTMATETVTVHIMGKDYQVACQEDEREHLLLSASELDKRMREIRQAGSVIGVERIAIMAALNLANEVLDSSRTNGDQKLLDDLHRRIDTVLS
jgi:cell division protein ZapA